jgi:hypothetical protein
MTRWGQKGIHRIIILVGDCGARYIYRNGYIYRNAMRGEGGELGACSVVRFDPRPAQCHALNAAFCFFAKWGGTVGAKCS